MVVAKDKTDGPGGAGMTPQDGPAPTPRLPCPFCGSARTQPFTHAGPGARVNMRCMDCGHQFKDPNLRR